VRLLLDTHTLLWALSKRTRLSLEVLALLSDPRNELIVSAASAWEIATKHRIGKLPAVEGLLATWGTTMARLGAIRLPVTDEHALLAGGLDWGHRDPFDRMLAAQSLVEQAPLVSGDEAFFSVEGLDLIW
jgi:PIN domain nuclease of toxin-antitoxin system